MDVATLKQRLQSDKPPNVRQTLDHAVTELDDPSSLTELLLEWIERGDLPPAIFTTYIRVSKDANILLAALNQSTDAHVRLAAINSLGLRLRSASEFRPTWDAMGGPSGVASLMQTLNVKDLARLCRVFGDTYRFPGARDEREREMSQLLRLLCDPDDPEPEKPGPNRDGTITRDSRLPHVRRLYEQIVKACTLDLCEEWIPANTRPTYTRPSFLDVLGQYRSHPDTFQAKALQCVFDQEQKLVKLGAFSLIYPGDFSFSKMLLMKIAEELPNDWRFDRAESFIYLATAHATHLQKRRRLSFTDQYTFWHMILVCFQRFPDLSARLGFDHRIRELVMAYHVSGWLWIRAISWWASTRTAKRRAKASEVLQSILKLVPEDMGLSCHLYAEMFCCAKVRVVLRHELLRLLFRHQKMYGFDIDSPGKADRAKMKDLLKIPVELLDMMLPESAVKLHKLMLDLEPTHQVIAPQYPLSIFNKTNDYEPGTLLFRAYLQSRLPADSYQREPALDRNLDSELHVRMERAAKGKPHGLRSLWIRSALLLSIAQGSLEEYSVVLQWASQFDADGVSAKTTYSRNVLGTQEGLNLLCGIPSAEAVSCRTITEVKESIETANKTILSVFESVARAAAIAEHVEDRLTSVSKKGKKKTRHGPSFWTYPGILPSEVVARRLRHVNAFQSYWRLSDEEVYECIWRPTLEMLISAEKFALNDENKRLGDERVEGILRFTEYPPGRNIRNPTWRFMDNLAKDRDLIWKEKRAQGSASAEEPSPHGLPVQHLLPFVRGAVGQVPHKLPYVVSRAMEVVFSGREALLDPKNEKKGSNDRFRDNVRDCIWLCAVGQHPDGPRDINKRVFWLWDHVIKQSVAGRMSRAAAVKYWNPWEFDLLFTRKHHHCR